MEEAPGEAAAPRPEASGGQWRLKRFVWAKRDFVDWWIPVQQLCSAKVFRPSPLAFREACPSLILIAQNADPFAENRVQEPINFQVQPPTAASAVTVSVWSIFRGHQSALLVEGHPGARVDESQVQACFQGVAWPCTEEHLWNCKLQMLQSRQLEIKDCALLPEL